MAPSASPIIDKAKPILKPNTVMFAAVRKALGIIPEIAMMILSVTLIRRNRKGLDAKYSKNIGSILYSNSIHLYPMPQTVIKWSSAGNPALRSFSLRLRTWESIVLSSVATPCPQMDEIK